MSERDYKPSIEPWTLGEDILRDTLDARRFIDQRGNFSTSTQRGVREHLGDTALKYGDIQAFIKTPIANLILAEQGLTSAYSDFEVLTTIKDIIYEEYIVGESKTKSGLQVVTEAPEDIYRTLPPSVQKKAMKSGSSMHLVLNENTRMTYIPNSVVDFSTLAEVGGEQVAQPFDYMPYVHAINALYSDHLEKSQPGVRSGASSLLHEAINYQHPLTGHAVEVISEHLLFVDPLNDGHFLRMHGSVQGILRKFIVREYDTEAGEKKTGTLAVIWDPEDVKLLQNSHATAADIDRSSETTYIPLDDPHTISAL